MADEPDCENSIPNVPSVLGELRTTYFQRRGSVLLWVGIGTNAQLTESGNDSKPLSRCCTVDRPSVSSTAAWESSKAASRVRKRSTIVSGLQRNGNHQCK
jgi:hypothetical protein